jgi:hypothetical protein
VFHAVPDGFGFEGAIPHGVHHFFVVRAPVPDGGAQVGLGRKGRHIGVVPDGIHPFFLGRFLGAGRILVLGDDIRADVQQALGGFFFRGRIIPGFGPDDPHLGVGVHGLGTQGKGIDAPDDFRDGESGHVTQGIGFRHGAGHHAGQVAGLIHPTEVVAHIGGGFEPRAVHEDRLGKLLGHFQHGVHVAEAGGKNQVIVFAGHVEHDALGVGAFGNGFHIGGRNTVQLVDEKASLVMGIGPTGIPDGRYVNKANLQVLGRSWPSDQGQHHTTQNHDDSSAHNVPPKRL